MLSRRWGVGLMVAVTALVIAAAALAQQVGQPESYHHFADGRAWLGYRDLGTLFRMCRSPSLAYGDLCF
jgi:hypothetical protein